MSGSIVKVDAVRKTFVQQGPFPWSPKTDIQAVKGVNLELQAGDIVAIVGQSGSGKTTLARLILGLEDVTEGAITLEDKRWDQMDEAERYPFRAKYQYVPQDAMSALDPQQNALEHVVETLRVLAGLDAEQARAQAAKMLENLGLAHRHHALPRQMSGGEQRRVTLARVLALKPRLVVADEPTSGLEPDRREAVLRDLIGNLPEDAACILVTHDMGAARKWATRTVVMLDGRIIEDLDLREDDPCHPYAQLLFDPWSSALPRSALAKTGCPFRNDCPLCESPIAERCAAEVPSLHNIDGDTHSVACHARERKPE